MWRGVSRVVNRPPSNPTLLVADEEKDRRPTEGPKYDEVVARGDVQNALSLGRRISGPSPPSRTSRKTGYRGPSLNEIKERNGYAIKTARVTPRGDKQVIILSI